MKYESQHIIRLFEHDKLSLGTHSFEEQHLDALQRYHGEKGTPYFTLIHKGVRFNQHVGVIRVGRLIIEVLPKTDRSPVNGSDEEKKKWQKVLIRMLQLTSGIKASKTSESSLDLKNSTILDFYIDLYLQECEKLVRQGRIRQYRRVKENQHAIKGKLELSTHIRKNLIHRERFFVEYSLYDRNHLIHQLMNEALQLLAGSFNRPRFYSRLKNLLLEFEECDRIRPVQKHFTGIQFNRKNERYRQALTIAHMLLFNFHPDIRWGQNHVMALMFDMNSLWEKFIGRMLAKHLGERYQIRQQAGMLFWKSDFGSRKLKPDYLLWDRAEPGTGIIVDTKWKTPVDSSPSDEDLRQMYAYNQLFGLKNSILIYPGSAEMVAGQYQTSDNSGCTVAVVDILNKKGELNTGRDVFEQFFLTVINNSPENGYN